MSINIHFCPEQWEQLNHDWSAWWAGELDRPMVMIEGFVPSSDQPDYNSWQDLVPYLFSLTTPADRVIDYFQRQLESMRYYGDAWPRWWPNFGPGIAASFLGACLIPTKDTTWFEPEEEIALPQLNLGFNPENEWWRRVKELTELAVERWGESVCVGFTDLGGNLDILASFLTPQQLLFALIDAPEEVICQVKTITSAWLCYYLELAAIIVPAGRGTCPWGSIWSPKRCYMLQSDFAYMISPSMFERFVLPDLEACCNEMEHGFYHLDGKGQIPHLDLLLSIDRLRGIQWIPGEGSPPPQAWLPLLKRIREGGKLCQIYVSPEGARSIVRELGGRGFALHINQTMKEDEARSFLQMLASEGDRCPITP
jgi:hypothetical protein